jgi:hypothetical protein
MPKKKELKTFCFPTYEFVCEAENELDAQEQLAKHLEVNNNTKEQEDDK